MPPTLFTTMSMRPSSRGRDVGQAGHRVEVAEVGRHHHRLPAERLHLRGDRVELLLRARRQHDVGAGLGQRQRGGGADAAPGAGHDRHLVIDAEPVVGSSGEVTHRNLTGPLMTCVTTRAIPD